MGSGTWKSGASRRIYISPYKKALGIGKVPSSSHGGPENRKNSELFPYRFIKFPSFFSHRAGKIWNMVFIWKMSNYRREKLWGLNSFRWSTPISSPRVKDKPRLSQDFMSIDRSDGLFLADFEDFQRNRHRSRGNFIKKWSWEGEPTFLHVLRPPDNESSYE